MATYKKSDDTKQKLLRSAKTLFYEKGYFNTSIKDISESAGVNRALISYHFGSKEGLAVEISNELTRKILKEISKRIKMLDNSVDTLVLIALQFRQFALFRKNNANYRRFMVELAKENVLVLGEKHIGFELVDIIKEEYQLDLSEADKRLAHFSITGIISSIMIVHDMGLIDCTNEYASEKEVEMLLKILDFDKALIKQVIEESRKLSEKINIRVGKNFSIA
ncbi:MAG: TetR/AcrR family transcriptional regulator [Eubacteriaceae bacterium]|nr:TetR/AcrR family transcriptional regulator [Eubacteriaceae bacterium]